MLGEQQTDLDPETTEWGAEQVIMFVAMLVNNFSTMTMEYNIASFVP
jgi:hypothetical protein